MTPNLHDLESAEASLEWAVSRWPTIDLVRVVGDLPNDRQGLACIGPYDVPANARHAYGTLWRGLDARDATELVKSFASVALLHRHWDTHDGTCPKCGDGGKITDYDYGTYGEARHTRDLSDEVKAYPYRHCRWGHISEEYEE